MHSNKLNDSDWTVNFEPDSFTLTQNYNRSASTCPYISQSQPHWEKLTNHSSWENFQKETLKPNSIIRRLISIAIINSIDFQVVASRGLTLHSREALLKEHYRIGKKKTRLKDLHKTYTSLIMTIVQNIPQNIFVWIVIFDEN